MTGKGAKSVATGTTPPQRNGADTKAVPNYLRPSTGSCHNACKYGGHHAFEEKEVPKDQPRPRKQPSASDDQKRRLVKVRSVSRRRVGDFGKTGKADRLVGETVEWKDIVAYDAVEVLPLPANGPDGRKSDVMKGKKPFAKTTGQEIVAKKPTESLNKKLVKTVRSKLTGKASTSSQAIGGAKDASSSDNKKMIDKSTKSVKPLKTKKSTTLPIEKKVVSQEVVQGDATTGDKQGETIYPPDQEEHAAVSESGKPIPVHRRAKSMSISSRSVRFPFIRQASKNAATFKLRSKSSKAPVLADEDEKPTRLRFRKGRAAAGEEPSSGIQLRIRSLRRRGSGISRGATSTGFVVPEVTLRHQKTLEKKKSRRLYNNLIEETASKLAKSRKSRVKSLVGAFETLISKIGK